MASPTPRKRRGLWLGGAWCWLRCCWRAARRRAARRCIVVQLQPAPLVRTLQFSARVATLSRVDVGSTIIGRAAQVLVTEGAQVRKGDALLRLELDELAAAVTQAVAAERQAAARLAGLRAAPGGTLPVGPGRCHAACRAG